MELKYKIWNAIKKGLNEALSNLAIDDFDDIETNDVGVDDVEKYDDIETQDGKEEHERWKFIKDNFVDLWLPSGTLWMKHNLGATCENTVKSWYGHYYMWGSINSSGDSYYAWKTTPFNNGKDDEYNSDYFEAHMHEFVDQDGQLLPEYDIAHQIDARIHMPTREQFEELCSLPNEWVNNYNGIRFLDGIIFTGLNGNTLFIPAAGDIWGSHLYNADSQCKLWSKSLDMQYQNLAFHLYIDRWKVKPNNHDERLRGLPIRGVTQMVHPKKHNTHK